MLQESEKLEYETCVNLMIHHENNRMGLLQFFAVFNAALFGFLATLYQFNIDLMNGFMLLILGLFAFTISLVMLNGEIREMAYWTHYVVRARKIEELEDLRLASTDKNPKIGHMDTFRGGYREIIKSEEWKHEVPEHERKLGYGKPKNYMEIWRGPFYTFFGTSRRVIMSAFFLIIACAWLIVSIIGALIIFNFL